MKILTDADASFATAASVYACVNGGLSCANGMQFAINFDVGDGESYKRIFKGAPERCEKNQTSILVKSSNCSFCNCASYLLHIDEEKNWEIEIK